MSFTKIAGISLCIYTFLTSYTIGSDHTVSQSGNTIICTEDTNGICNIYCDGDASDGYFSCGNAGECNFYCNAPQCAQRAAITGSNARNLNVFVGPNGDRCMQTSRINAPNYGNATFDMGNSAQGFIGMRVYASTHTQNILIDITSNTVIGDDVKGMEVHAGSAEYVQITLSNGLEWEGGHLSCPVNSPYSGPNIAPCVIDASDGNGIVRDNIISAPDGIPKNLYINGGIIEGINRVTCMNIPGTDILPISANSPCLSTWNPTTDPTQSPTERHPSKAPTNNPTQLPTNIPSYNPTNNPTVTPTEFPSSNPSQIPTVSPSHTSKPTSVPSATPTFAPITSNPSYKPSNTPSVTPTHYPTESPTDNPSTAPITQQPSLSPSQNPTHIPSKTPTNMPTETPTQYTSFPTHNPSHFPSQNPTNFPSEPSKTPTNVPTYSPTQTTSIPTPNPTQTTPTPTTIAHWICQDSCWHSRDDHVIQIEVTYWFADKLEYNLKNIECFLHKIFLNWFSRYTFIFNFCDINVNNIRGGIQNNDDSFCVVGPCLDTQLVNRRRLSHNIDANSTMTIITDDTEVYNIISNFKLPMMETEFETEFTQHFNVEMDVQILVEQYKDGNTLNESKSISVSPLWYIVLILILCLCFVGLILFWYVHRSNKLHQKMSNHINQVSAVKPSKNIHRSKAYSNVYQQSPTSDCKEDIDFDIESIRPIPNTLALSNAISGTIDFGVYTAESTTSKNAKPRPWNGNSIHSIEMVTHNKLYGFKNNYEGNDISALTEIEHETDADSTMAEPDTKSRIASEATIAEQQFLLSRSKLQSSKNNVLSPDGNWVTPDTDQWTDFDTFYQQTMQHMAANGNVSDRSLAQIHSSVNPSDSWRNFTDVYGTAKKSYNQQIMPPRQGYVPTPRDSAGLDSIKPNTVLKLANKFNKSIQSYDQQNVILPQQASASYLSQTITKSVSRGDSTNTTSMTYTTSSGVTQAETEEYTSDIEQDEKTLSMPTLALQNAKSNTLSMPQENVMREIRMSVMDSVDSEDTLVNIGKKLSFQKINTWSEEKQISTETVVMYDEEPVPSESMILKGNLKNGFLPNVATLDVLEESNIIEVELEKGKKTHKRRRGIK